MMVHMYLRPFSISLKTISEASLLSLTILKPRHYKIHHFHQLLWLDGRRKMSRSHKTPGVFKRASSSKTTKTKPTD